MKRNERVLGIPRRTKCLTFGILFLFILISAPSDAQRPANGRSMANFRPNSQSQQNSFRNRQALQQESTLAGALNDQQRILEELERKLQQQRELANEIARRKEELLRLQNLNRDTASQITGMHSNKHGTIGMSNERFGNKNSNGSEISSNAQRPVNANFDKFPRVQTQWKNNLNNANRPGNLRQDSLAEFNRNNRRSKVSNGARLQRFSDGNDWRSPNADRLNVQHTQISSGINKANDNPGMRNTHVSSKLNSNNFKNVGGRLTNSHKDPFYLNNANRNNDNRRRIRGHRTEVPFRNAANAGLNTRSLSFKNSIPRNRPNIHRTNFQQGVYQNPNLVDNVPIQQTRNTQSRTDMKSAARVEERNTRTKGFPLRRTSHFDRIWQSNVNDKNTRAKWPARNHDNRKHEPQIGHGAFQTKKPFAISDPFRKTQIQLTPDSQNAYQNDMNSISNWNNSAVVLRYKNGQLRVRNDQIVKLQSHQMLTERNSQQTGRSSSTLDVNNINQPPLQSSVPHYNEQYQSNIKPQATVMNNPGVVHANRHDEQPRGKNFVPTTRSDSFPRNFVNSASQRQHRDFGRHITETNKPAAKNIFSDRSVLHSDWQGQSSPKTSHQGLFSGQLSNEMANTYPEQSSVNRQAFATQPQTVPRQNQLVNTPNISPVVRTRPNGVAQNSQPKNFVSNYNNVNPGMVQSNAGPLGPNKNAFRRTSEPVNVVLNNNNVPPIVVRSSVLPARASSNVAVQQNYQQGPDILNNNDAPPTFIRSNASPINIHSHVVLPETSQPVNVLLKNNDMLPSAVKSNSHASAQQIAALKQISTGIGSNYPPGNVPHGQSQQTDQTLILSSKPASQLGNISPNSKAFSSQHLAMPGQNQHSVTKQTNTSALDIHATVAKLQQVLQTLHSKSQNKNLLSAAQQSHGISPIAAQTAPASPMVAQNSNVQTIGVNQNYSPLVTNLQQSHAPHVFGAGQVWNGGFNQFSPAVGASMWQQFMFGDSIDPPDMPDPTGTPVPGTEIEIEGVPATTTTTTVATTKKPTTTTKRVVTTLAPQKTTKSNIIHSIALKLASLLGKTGGLPLIPNAKTSDTAIISSHTIKDKPLTKAVKKQPETSKNKVIVVEKNIKHSAPKNIINVDAIATDVVNSGKPIVVTVNKPPVTFLSGKPLEGRKAAQAIVNVAANDILNNALDPVLAGFNVKNVIAQQIGHGLNSNSIGALKTVPLTQSGQQIVSVQGDKLADVSKILSGETVTPSVPVDNTQLAPSVTIKQTPSAVNAIPLINDKSNNAGVNGALIKDVYHETTPVTTMIVDQTVSPPQATDATSLIKSAVVDILSKIKHLWTSSDLSTTVSPTTTTKKPCTPNSPEFTCKGLGPFATVDSVGPWCVEKCKQNACVESVCECSCPSPQLGVAGWQGPTTESALGPLDRINTTDVPEEIEAVPDKTPAEGGRLRPGQRWRKRKGWKGRQGRRGRPGRRRNNWKRRKWNRRQRRTTTQIVATTVEPPEEEEIEQEDAVTTARAITTTVPMVTTTEATWTSTIPFYDVTLNAYDVTMDSSKDYQLSTVVPIDTQKYKDEFKSSEVRWGSDWRPRTQDRSKSRSVGPTSGYDILGVNPETLNQGTTGFIPDIERAGWGRKKSASSKNPEPDDDEPECTCANQRKPPPQWNRRQTTERSWRAPPRRDGWRVRGQNSGPLGNGRDRHNGRWPEGSSPTDRPWGRDSWRDSGRRGRSHEPWGEPSRGRGRSNRWRDPPPARESGPPTGWDPRDQWVPPDRQGDRRRFGLRDRWRESTTKANEEENEANDKKK